MRRFSIAVLAAALSAGLLVVSAEAGPDCEWLAGDLHVHTWYSHDAYGGPGDDNTGHDEFYTLGHSVGSQFAIAASRGLDYLAISDHNDVRSVTDPGFGTNGVLGVRGYENSLRGHAQMLGADRLFDNGDRGVAAVEGLRDQLRAEGGTFQINHPGTGDWALGNQVVPDTVEVWNISRLYHPPLPSASDNDDAIRLWEAFLDAGHKVGATGGSDNHYVATTAVQGVGQPTTWVCATATTEAGVLEGLRAGRTTISHQPPAFGGARIYLEGDGNGDGTFESMVGDTIPPGSKVSVRAVGAPGSLLRLFTDGGRILAKDIPVASHDFRYTLDAPGDSTWLRAELYEPDVKAERRALCDGFLGPYTTYCRNDIATLAMTSAIFFASQSEPVATTLTWVGDTRGKGETVDLAARLTDESGAPVAGETVIFAAGGNSYSAETGPDGVARTTGTIPDHGKSQTVRADYLGAGEYLASSVIATITWGNTPPGKNKESR